MLHERYNTYKHDDGINIYDDMMYKYVALLILRTYVVRTERDVLRIWGELTVIIIQETNSTTSDDTVG